MFIHIIEFKFFIKNTSFKIENTNTNSFEKRKKKQDSITPLKKELEARLFLIEFDGCGKFRLRSYQIP